MRARALILATACSMAATASVDAAAQTASGPCPAGGVSSAEVRDGGSYKVLAISPKDAFHSDRAALIGEIGSVSQVSASGACWVSAELLLPDGSSRFFHEVELVPVDRAIATAPVPDAWTASCPPGAVAAAYPGERLQILTIHPEDAYHTSRSQYERKYGRADGLSTSDTPCFLGGSFTLDDGTSMYFYKASFSRGAPVDARPKLAQEEGCPEGAVAGPVWPGSRVSVLAIHADDAWFPDRAGLEGQFGATETTLEGQGCWLEGAVRTDDGTYHFFHKVAVGAAQPSPVIRLAPATASTSLPEGTAVQIVDLHYYDGHNPRRDRLIGQDCEVEAGDLQDTGEGWLGGKLSCGGRSFSFFRVRVAER